MRSSYKVIVALWLLLVINVLDRSAISFAGPAIMKSLDMSPATFGIVLSSFGVGYALALIPGGLLVDRFGTRMVMVAAPVLWGLCTGATGFVTVLAGFVAVRFCLGLSEGAFSPTVYKSIGDYVEPKQRPLALAVSLSALTIGSAIAGSTVGLLMEFGGWQAMFLLLAFPCFAVAVAAYLLLPRRGATDAHEAAVSAPGEREPFRRVIAKPSLWVLALSNFAGDIAQWGYVAWMPSYLVLERNIDIKTAGLLGSIPFLFAFCGMLLGGWLGSTLLHRFRPHTVVFCFLATALSLMMAYSAHDLVGAVVGLSSAAFFLYGAQPSKGSIVIGLAPERARGAYVGTYTVAGNVGSAIAPAIIGMLVTATGTFSSGFMFMTGALCVAAGCFLVLMPILHSEAKLSAVRA